jgi:hypothetical protein
MPSIAYHQWRTTRAAALDEVARAHAAVGGTKRGRRYATQQINRAYAVLLASQFQGFCRDLHSECVEDLIAKLTTVPALRAMLRSEFTWNRQLDRGNAHPGSLGADFGRLGIEFWDEVQNLDPRNAARKKALEGLNDWRNAIAHQNFDPAKLGGRTTLRLEQVRQWRRICRHLARAFDEVMRRHLSILTGTSPW